MNKVIYKISLFVICLILGLEPSFAAMSLEELKEKSPDPQTQLFKTLSKIQDPAIACKEVWVYTQTNPKTIFELFNQSKKYPRAQIFLSSAYKHALSLNKEGIVFYEAAFFQLCKLLEKALPKLTWEKTENLAQEVLNAAKIAGSAFAHVVQLLKDRRPNFMYSAVLREYLNHADTSFNDLRFVYGCGLFWGTPIMGKLSCEGLNYMLKTQLLKITCGRDEDNFKELIGNKFSNYLYEHRFWEKIYFFEDEIIAPSEELWKNFCTKYLSNISTSTKKQFDFLHPYQTDLCKFWQIKEPASLTYANESKEAENVLKIYAGRTLIGEICMHQNRFKIDSESGVINFMTTNSLCIPYNSREFSRFIECAMGHGCLPLDVIFFLRRIFIETDMSILHTCLKI